MVKDTNQWATSAVREVFTSTARQCSQSVKGALLRNSLIQALTLASLHHLLAIVAISLLHYRTSNMVKRLECGSLIHLMPNRSYAKPPSISSNCSSFLLRIKCSKTWEWLA